MLIDSSIQTYLQELAKGSAVPGGGTAAALNGAQAAALLSMVCNLTIGRKKYAAVEYEMKTALSRAETLQNHLILLIDRDATAFDSVMAAYQMPKETTEEKAARSAAIQEGLKKATLVPLETLAACVDLLEMSPDVLAKGNPNVISDGGAGILAAHTGMMIAAINVRINLNAIKDESFTQKYEERMEALMQRGEDAREQAWAIVRERLGM